MVPKSSGMAKGRPLMGPGTPATHRHNRRRARIVRRHRIMMAEVATCRCGAREGDVHDERCDKWTPTGA
jgi:hypothetical protein